MTDDWTTIKIPDDTEEAWERYRTNPVFHTVINLKAQDEDMAVPTMLRAGSWEFQVNDERFGGWQRPVKNDVSLEKGGEMRVYETDDSNFKLYAKVEDKDMDGPKARITINGAKFYLPVPRYLFKLYRWFK